jgi:hypothetical protein
MNGDQRLIKIICDHFAAVVALPLAGYAAAGFRSLTGIAPISPWNSK